MAEPTGKGIDRSRAGQRGADVEFNDPTGEAVTLADFVGEPVLLNLWATWCAPCVAEMPTLDALAARQNKVQVLAVSQDVAGQETRIAAFFQERKLGSLEAYQDPNLALMEQLRVDTLPTTILFDRNGKEVWRVVGAMDWNGDEAAKLIAEAR